jgi:IclR family mhp operon transcriptional activator
VKRTANSGDLPIRAAERTLAILQAMNRRPVSTVDYLHKETGLPKPTLVRFLSTLSHAGFVISVRRHSGYRLTSLVRSLSSGYHSDPLIVEAGAAIAQRITREIKWPISIALPCSNGVVVRLSTAPDSPMSPFHSTINMHLGFFVRALGRAYVAFCDPAQIETYARQAVAEGAEGHQLARDPKALQSLLESIRWKGYALRDRHAEPRSSDTLAVPIFLDGVVRASVGTTFFRSAVRSEAALARLENLLKGASQEITVEIGRLRERGEPVAAAASAGRSGLEDDLAADMTRLAQRVGARRVGERHALDLRRPDRAAGDKAREPLDALPAAEDVGLEGGEVRTGRGRRRSAQRNEGGPAAAL